MCIKNDKTVQASNYGLEESNGYIFLVLTKQPTQHSFVLVFWSWLVPQQRSVQLAQLYKRTQEHGLVLIGWLYKQEGSSQLCEQSPEASSYKLLFHPVELNESELINQKPA